MKAKLTLIASALLVMSSIAGAQEQKAPSANPQQMAPSAKMTGQEVPSAAAQEEKAPSAGAQEQTAPSAKEVGELVGEILRNVKGHMGQGTMGQRMQHGGMHRIMFVLMDTNGDGTLSLEEFQTAHAKIFKAIDADKDGKVTLEEMQMFWPSDF